MSLESQHNMEIKHECNKHCAVSTQCLPGRLGVARLGHQIRATTAFGTSPCGFCSRPGGHETYRFDTQIGANDS